MNSMWHQGLVHAVSVSEDWISHPNPNLGLDSGSWETYSRQFFSCISNKMVTSINQMPLLYYCFKPYRNICSEQSMIIFYGKKNLKFGIWLKLGIIHLVRKQSFPKNWHF